MINFPEQRKHNESCNERGEGGCVCSAGDYNGVIVHCKLAVFKALNREEIADLIYKSTFHEPRHHVLAVADAIIAHLIGEERKT